MTQGLIIVGDVLDGLARLDDDSVDAVVTDPPYELAFMGSKWDATGVAFRQETWEACLRVLRPGGYMVVFGGTRTHHRMWCAIEDAGFEVRDMLTWLYGTGFPKSLDVSKAIDKAAGAEREKVSGKWATRYPNGPGGSSCQFSQKGTPSTRVGVPMDTIPATDAAKQWEGYGTALKPAVEPILLARKPLSESTVAANVLKWGTGALAIDATRIAYQSQAEENRARVPQPECHLPDGSAYALGTGKGRNGEVFDPSKGRWPSNVIFECTCDDPQPLPEKARKRKNEPTQSKLYTDAGATNFAAKPGAVRREGGGFVHQPDCPAGMLDAQSGTLTSGRLKREHIHRTRVSAYGEPTQGASQAEYGNDTGGASRFFYCAKASRAERERGLEDFEPISGAEAVNRKPDTAGLKSPRAGAGRSAKQVKCVHPTVKPIALMRWLVRLVTPPGGRVLDPFCGSGSTLIAAREEGHDFVGVDLSPEYCRIAEARVGGAQVVAAETPEDTEPEWEE